MCRNAADTLKQLRTLRTNNSLGGDRSDREVESETDCGKGAEIYLQMSKMITSCLRRLVHWIQPNGGIIGLSEDQHIPSEVFLSSLKFDCFHRGLNSAEGKALERDDYHVSNTFLLSTEESLYLPQV